MRHQSGFTLVEAIMVTAVLAVLAAVAVPNYLSWLPDIRLKDAAGDIKSDIQLARQKAIRENGRIALLFDMGANRYTIFVDNGAGGSATNAKNWIRDGSEELIKTITLPDNVVMYAAAFSGGAARFRFDGRGLPNGLGGNVRLRNANNKCRKLIISMLGRIREQISTDGGSTWEDVD
jgi:type IV fimbrial biogenesis protein FimT